MSPPDHDAEDDRLRREARDRDIDRLLEADRRAGDRRQDLPVGMPGGVWLFNELNALRTLITEQHGRIRTDMAEGFAGIVDQLHAHEAVDQAVAIRVALLEDREKRAVADATKRTLTTSSLVAAVVGPAAAMLWKKFFGG